MTVVERAGPATTTPGWLRTPGFDLTLIVGVAALALASGGIVVARPHLFPLVLFLDLWFLGYHHVVATFTRLTFDRESFREHRFLVLWAPLIVLVAVIGGALAAGPWLLATTYLYWQWWHYTRQSYGIERVYRRKAEGRVPGDDRLAKAMIYGVPLWGILYRSYQAPDEFLGMPLVVLPVPWTVVQVTGFAAVAVMVLWAARAVISFRRGERPLAYCLYMASHALIFVVGYVVIADVDHGWLVVNVWHNAQYILFVWMYNSNRFRGGVEPRARLLSTLSQRRNWGLYFLVTLGVSTVVYFLVERGLTPFDDSALPVFLVAYQAINFHHYLVDGVIWKVRKRPLRKNLGLSS